MRLLPPPDDLSIYRSKSEGEGCRSSVKREKTRQKKREKEPKES